MVRNVTGRPSPRPATPEGNAPVSAGRSHKRGAEDNLESPTLAPHLRAEAQRTAAQTAVSAPRRRPGAAATVRADAPDAVLVADLQNRYRGPFPLMFRNVREALLADATFGKTDAGIRQRATAYLRGHMEVYNRDAIIQEARRVNAKGLVKQGAFAWVSEPLNYEDFDAEEGGTLNETITRDIVSVPGGFVMLSEHDDYPLRFWHRDTTGWSNTPLRPLGVLDNAQAAPVALAAVEGGFVTLENTGAIYLYANPIADGQSIEPVTVIVLSPDEKPQWKSVIALGTDRIAATTEDHVVHVFAVGVGTWRREATFGVGHVITCIAAVGPTLAIASTESVVTLYDRDYKAQSIRSTEYVYELCAMDENTFAGIDSDGNAQVWWRNDTGWSHEVLDGVGSDSVMSVAYDCFVVASDYGLSTYRQTSTGWERHRTELDTGEDTRSDLRRLCRIGDGLVVVRAAGTSRLNEVTTTAAHFLNPPPSEAIGIDTALISGRLDLARGMIQTGQRVDDEVLRRMAMLDASAASTTADYLSRQLLLLAYSEGIDIRGVHGESMTRLALDQGGYAAAARHIAAGTAVDPADITLAQRMASQSGMMPVIAALMHRDLIAPEDMPTNVETVGPQGLTLALSLALYEPINIDAVEAAGARYGLFLPVGRAPTPSVIAAVMKLPSFAPEGILDSYMQAYTQQAKQDGGALRDTVLQLAVQPHMTPFLSRLIAAETLDSWSNISWESGTYIAPAADGLRRANMPPAILARYASLRNDAFFEAPPWVLNADQPFDERTRHLQMTLETDETGAAFLVDRDATSVPAELRATPLLWQADWSVGFDGEDGQDAGGVTRAWIANVLTMMTAPGGVMPPFADNPSLVYFNPAKTKTEALRTFGRFFGRAIKEGMSTGIEWPRHLLEMLAGRASTMESLAQFDPKYARSLQYILETKGAEDGTSFEATDPRNPKTTVPLRPGGDPNEPVTHLNKKQYGEAMVHHILNVRYRAEIEAVLTGVFDVVDARLLRNFTTEELVGLTAGIRQFDVDAWRDHSYVVVDVQDANWRSEPYATVQTMSEGDEAPLMLSVRARASRWFFDAVRKLDDEERAVLFEAVTNNKRVPGAGFAAMPSPFLVNVNLKQLTGVPTAATCDYRINMPNYRTPEELEKGLQRFIDEMRVSMNFTMR